MRVIAGKRKGIALRIGHGAQFRPTAQVVKGSVFDTLGTMIQDATFCDLFAGSGAVGIEALSRGARRAIFVEQDHRIMRALRTNLERCKFSFRESQVRMGDATRFLERLVRGKDSFDIIFADPPYAGDLSQRIVKIVEEGKHRICRLFIVEHGQPLFCGDTGMLEKVRTRKFGQTYVSYFQYRDRKVELS